MTLVTLLALSVVLTLLFLNLTSATSLALLRSGKGGHSLVDLSLVKLILSNLGVLLTLTVLSLATIALGNLVYSDDRLSRRCCAFTLALLVLTVVLPELCRAESNARTDHRANGSPSHETEGSAKGCRAEVFGVIRGERESGGGDGEQRETGDELGRLVRNCSKRGRERERDR